MLGWDKHEQHLPVEIDGKPYQLNAIARAKLGAKYLDNLQENSTILVG